MTQRLEAHMVEPVGLLLRAELGLDVIVGEFSAGYGVADLVGATISESNCRARVQMGLASPLDHKHLVETISVLRTRRRRSIPYLLARLPFSQTTLLRKVLPRLKSMGLIERHPDGYVRLLKYPPYPVEKIVAVEPDLRGPVAWRRSPCGPQAAVSTPCGPDRRRP